MPYEQCQRRSCGLKRAFLEWWWWVPASRSTGDRPCEAPAPACRGGVAYSRWDGMGWAAAARTIIAQERCSLPISSARVRGTPLVKELYTWEPGNGQDIKKPWDAIHPNVSLNALFTAAQRHSSAAAQQRCSARPQLLVYRSKQEAWSPRPSGSQPTPDGRRLCSPRRGQAHVPGAG
jgi:hypothetical protein